MANKVYDEDTKENSLYNRSKENEKKAEKDQASLNSREREYANNFLENIADDELGSSSKYRPSVKKKKSGGSGIFSRRNKLIGGGVGGIIGAILVMLPVLLKPFEFIHISQLLQRNFASIELMADQRIGAHIRSYQWGGKGQYIGSRLGTVSNRIANKIETRMANNGIELIYTPDTGVLTGIEIDGRVVADFDSGDSNRFRRSVSRAEISKKMGWNKATTAIMTRLPFTRYDINLRVLGNVRRQANESLQDWLNRVRADKEARIGDTSFNYDGLRRAIDDIEAKEAAGQDLNPAEQDLLDAYRNGGGDVDGISRDMLEAYNNTTGDHNTKLKASAEVLSRYSGGASIVATVLALSCLIDSLTEQEKVAMFENVYLPLMRMSGDAISIGSQLQAGEDVSFDELSVHNESLYDTSTDPGNSWAESAGFDGGEPIPPEYKTNSRETPTVVRVLGTVESILDATGVGLLTENALVCSAATNPWLGWGLFVVEVGAGILSAGATFAGGQAAKIAVQRTISELLTDFIAGKAISASSSWVLSSMIGKVVPALAKGALYGSIISIGSHYNANESARSSGGISLNQEDAAALDSHLRDLRIADSKERGFAYRYFDLNNPDSLVSAVWQGLTGKSVKNIPNNFTNIASSTSNNLANFLSGEAFAQEETNYETDLGAKKIAFSMEEVYPDDPILSDPFKAEQYVNDNNLDERYSGCLKSPVESYRQGNYDELEDFWLSPMPNVGSCDYPRTQQELYDFSVYRVHHFDLLNILSLACLEGDEQSCTELGINTISPNTGLTGLTAGNEIVGDPYTDSTNVACAPGTIDLGIHDAWVSGNQVDMRLCALTNMPSRGDESTPGNVFYIENADGRAIVNSRMSGAWYGLVEAAKADGVTISASQSYRTHEHQTVICQRNPGCMDQTNNSVAAYPGTSSHQAGVAIDLAGISNGTVSGQTCAEGVRQTDNSATYRWMFNNAYKWGIKQYSAEAWHWDALDKINRCGEPTWNPYSPA